MIVLAVLAWPVLGLVCAGILVLIGRSLTPQPKPPTANNLPPIPDWACPMQCPPAMTIDSDGNLQEVWSQ